MVFSCLWEDSKQLAGVAYRQIVLKDLHMLIVEADSGIFRISAHVRIVVSHAKSHQFLVQYVDRISQAQPDPHIEIAQLVQAIAVVPAFLKASPLKKDTWMAKRVAVEEKVM